MTDWRPEDKEWLKARKKAWKPILQSLQESPETKRADIKPLREYFLTGQEPEINPYEDKYFFLLHRLWFHPDQSKDNWQQLIEATDVDDFQISRELFVRETRDPNLHPTEYGFMGGIEQQVVQLFFPETNPTAKFQFKGEILQTLPWRQDNFFMMWGLSMSNWLTYHASNPYCIAQYLLGHMWGSLHLFDQEHLRKSGDNWLRDILMQCAHFVEPQGLLGDDTPQRRFVKAFKRELNDRELPAFIKIIWEEVQTRLGRSRWTGESIDEQGMPLSDLGGYITLVIHNIELKAEIFEQLVEIYRKLGYSDTKFNSAQIDDINLGSHLTPEVIVRLGFKEGDAIPGYRFQIKTNSEYVDSDGGQIAVDLIMPVPPQNYSYQEDTPVFFVVPRPAEPYHIDGALAYNLNVNQVRRTFKSEYGFNLLRYQDLSRFGKPPLFEKKNPFYQAKNQPMVNFRNAIVNTSREDFPKWQGTPLPPLFK